MLLGVKQLRVGGTVGKSESQDCVMGQGRKYDKEGWPEGVWAGLVKDSFGVCAEYANRRKDFNQGSDVTWFTSKNKLTGGRCRLSQ